MQLEKIEISSKEIKESYLKSNELVRNFENTLDEIDEVFKYIQQKENRTFNKINTSAILLEIIFFELLLSEDQKNKYPTSRENIINELVIPKCLILLVIEKLIVDCFKNTLNKNELIKKIDYYIDDYVLKNITNIQNKNLNSQTGIINYLSVKNDFSVDILNYYKRDKNKILNVAIGQ